MNIISNWWNREKLEQANQTIRELQRDLAYQKTILKIAEDQLTLREQQLSQEQAHAAALEQERDEAHLATKDAEEKIKDLRAQLEPLLAKRTDARPWFMIESYDLDPVKGLRTELDWNEAFIQYLRDNGHSSKDERVMVQRWIAMLYTHLIERLEAQVAELQDRPNDFE